LLFPDGNIVEGDYEKATSGNNDVILWKIINAMQNGEIDSGLRSITTHIFELPEKDFQNALKSIDTSSVRQVCFRNFMNLSKGKP